MMIIVVRPVPALGTGVPDRVGNFIRRDARRHRVWVLNHDANHLYDIPKRSRIERIELPGWSLRFRLVRNAIQREQAVGSARSD